jgi:hypothetical protein
MILESPTDGPWCSVVLSLCRENTTTDDIGCGLYREHLLKCKRIGRKCSEVLGTMLVVCKLTLSNGNLIGGMA